MKIVGWLALFALLGQGAVASAQEGVLGEAAGARIWLDRGEEPVLQTGERVRIYYRTAADAYVAIFHIDTDGVVHLLHPRGPGEDAYTRGGRDYRLLFPQSSYWYVDEYPGKGYFFLVASPEPLDLSAFGYVRTAGRWDLSGAGGQVYRDPYLAMDDYVALLIPDWEAVPYALDFLSYDVGEVHDYPRFLCYDCHGYRSYAAWNPYTYACASFRVVVWDDPYFYPALRYGSGAVFVTPRRALARFEFKERAAGESWTPLLRTREAQPRRGVQYAEPDAAPARAGGSGAIPLRRPSSRPDGAVPSRSTGPSRSVAPAPAPGRSTSGTAPDERPVLQRRPSSPAASGAGGGSAVRPPATTRPSPAARPAGDPGSAGAQPPREARPSGSPQTGGVRVVRPPSGGASATPSSGVRTSSPPAASSRPPSSSRPTARPSASSGSRPSGGTTSRAAPPPRRKPPGGG